MDSDAFYRKYLDALQGQERRIHETEQRLDRAARDAIEVEEERILENLEKLLDEPGRRRAEAFREELAGIAESVPQLPRAAADKPTLESLQVRSLHMLARLDSTLRHSIVEACLMNLRGYADVLDERAEDVGFLERLGDQVGLIPGVAKQIVDFFNQPILAGLAIRDFLPMACKAGLAAVKSILWVVERFRGAKRGQAPFGGQELASRVDELTEALTGVRTLLDGRRQSLSGVVRGGVEALRPQAEAAGIRLTFEDETEDGVRLFLDETRLSNAVGEMVRNAMRHGLADVREGAAIRVVVQEDAPPSTEVRVVVEDNGSGFDAAVLERLGEGAVSTSGGGAGFGLVREAAREHVGRIEVESPAAGGARVSIVLPRHPVLEADAEA